MFTIYEKKSYPSRDEALESYETESEALETMRVIRKYSSNPDDYYIREEKDEYRWLENADCFCYGDYVD